MGTRTVAVPPVIGDRLRKWLADLPNRERQANLVVTSPKGYMLRYDNFRRDFHRALQRAGLNHAGTHELRRHAASWLINLCGVTVTDATDMLGNTPDVLERHYRKHQTPARLAAAVSHITDRRSEVIKLAVRSASMLALSSGATIDTQTGQLIDVINVDALD
jgi:integrase